MVKNLLTFLASLTLVSSSYFSFGQTYCTPPDDCTDDYIVSFSTTGGTTNITNNNTGCTGGGYTFYSTMIHSSAPGTTVNFSFTNNPGWSEYYKIWVDWNNNGSFLDAGEQMYASSTAIATSATVTGSFVIPPAATPGNKRMRIRCAFSESALDPCLGSLILCGETEDYVLNVSGTASACATPTALTATTITAASASLNWTQTGTVAGWQIKYGAPGFNPATAGTAIYTTTKPYTLPGLASSTTYNYYVRAVCAPSDTTIWSAVHSFTTLCNAPSILTRKDSSRCGPGEVVLGATASAGGVINWYANQTGGNSLATGNSFTTPSLATTTNYYVSASGGGGGVTNGSIATLTGGTNGCGGGVMFNITPTVDIVVDSFLNLSNAAQTTTVTVYYKTGTYVGSELTPAAWTTLGTVSVNTAAGTMIPINVGASISMTAGTTYGIFIANMSNGYTDGNGPNQVFTNADLTLNAGAGLCGVFTSTVNSPRVFNGTVFYHKGSSCQSPRLPVVATIKAAPAVNLGNDTTICPNVTYTFNAGNPSATYLWTTGATSQSITANTAGSYGVQVTATNGCVNSDNITITQGINPVNVLAATTNLCEGSTASLNAGNTGSTFLWSPNGQVTQTINETDGGTYSVAIKSVDGCKITSSTNVIIRPLPVDNLGNDTSICDGATIPLDAGNPGYAYLWSNGATTQVVNASDSGLYTVTVTTPFNCINEDEIHISYLPSPRVEGFNFIPQFYENLGQVAFSPLNPTNVNSYLWDFGDGSPTSTAVNPVHTYTTAGNFIVTLKVFNGCGDFDISLPINVDLTTGIVGPGKVAAELSLYPNPAQNMITIENKSSDIKMQELNVFNILGANVHAAKVNSGNKHQFSVAHLAPGIYTVRILTDKGFVVRKFEVMK